MKRWAPNHSLRKLIAEIRYAAANIESAQFRAVAAREAGRIPETLVEKSRAKKGEIARLARQIMRRLPELDGVNELMEAQIVLRNCADALDAPFEKTSETWPGRRQPARAGAGEIF